MKHKPSQIDSKANDILAEVSKYYSAKLAEHGETPLGVDWNSEESQVLRFDQLVKVIQSPAGFSLNDLGCGYGSLLEYMNSRYRDFSYFGYDVSEDMVGAAQDRYAKSTNAHFAVTAEPPVAADYGIASGIFNVRLGRSDIEWRAYLEATLEVLNRTSRLGFSFNCLTSYSDAERMRDYLYYADPCAIFDLCKRRYSRHVALLHDYGLYEFTILVRKEL
jgi:SAM-dependent methyltransferase